jgi:hypothetical protein
LKIMTFRLEPGLAITQSVRQAGTEQIDRALSKLAGKAKKGNAVHETRKAIKRLRALLHLIKPAMRKADFRIGDARLKQIAKSLSGVREIQAMIETVAKLDAYDEQVGRGPVASQLRPHLEEMRDAAETSPNGSGAERARKLGLDGFGLTARGSQVDGLVQGGGRGGAGGFVVERVELLVEWLGTRRTVVSDFQHLSYITVVLLRKSSSYLAVACVAAFIY